MRALSLEPGVSSSMDVEEVAEPPHAEGAVLVGTSAIGVCGTDREMLAGNVGVAPPGHRRLIVGHESIGRVLDAPPNSGFSRGEWVVGIVRRPDPVPCASCAAGEWDMCLNGRYTERGIKALHGFGADRYRSDARYLVKVDGCLADLGVLLEPASVVAKAWEHTEHIASRASARATRVLVTGAGPIGLLAALLGVQRGLDVHVFDREKTGPKPRLVRELGATYHQGDLSALGGGWDVTFECTGASQLFFPVIRAAAPSGIVCLAGLSSGGHVVSADPGGLNREMVLENNVVFGSVNAGRRHYEQAATALARADGGWLSQVITRRVPVADWAKAFIREPGDVKTIITFE